MLAQIGARVPKGSLDPRELLLSMGDIPGERWRQIDQRLWRAGEGVDADWARLARRSKSLTGWRSFEQRGNRRWIWTQASIPPTREAAQSAIADTPKRMLTNLRSEVAVRQGVEMDPPPILGAGEVWAREDRTSGPHGAGLAKYLVWTVRNVISAAAWSGFGDAWTWDSVADLAAVQTSRITDALNDRARPSISG